MNNNVRKLTDGAMMTAIVGVLLLINRQFGGLFEESFLFLFPLPMVFYSAKYGMKDSWLTFVAIILLTIVLGTPQTLFYVASESLIGLIYGSGIYKGSDTRKLVLLTMLISVIANIFSTIIYAQFFGYNIVEEMKEIQNVLVSTFESQGVSIPSTINLSNFIFTALIVATIMTGVMQAFITHVLARILLKRMNFKIEPATPAWKYFPPLWSGYLAFAGACAYFYCVARPLPNELLNSAMIGLGMCGVLYLIVYGYIAIIVYARLNMPKYRFFAVLFALFLIVSMPMVMITIGFLYITTSWHKRMLEDKLHAAKTE